MLKHSELRSHTTSVRAGPTRLVLDSRLDSYLWKSPPFRGNNSNQAIANRITSSRLSGSQILQRLLYLRHQLRA